jgi:hypothetical protein
MKASVEIAKFYTNFLIQIFPSVLQAKFYIHQIKSTIRSRSSIILLPRVKRTNLLLFLAFDHSRKSFFIFIFTTTTTTLLKLFYIQRYNKATTRNNVTSKGDDQHNGLLSRVTILFIPKISTANNTAKTSKS